MQRETAFNLTFAAGLLVLPLWAWWADEPFYITLVTRVVILALAGVGLNLALGLAVHR